MFLCNSAVHMQRLELSQFMQCAASAAACVFALAVSTSVKTKKPRPGSRFPAAGACEPLLWRTVPVKVMCDVTVMNPPEVQDSAEMNPAVVGAVWLVCVCVCVCLCMCMCMCLFH